MIEALLKRVCLLSVYLWGRIEESLSYREFGRLSHASSRRVCVHFQSHHVIL